MQVNKGSYLIKQMVSHNTDISLTPTTHTNTCSFGHEDISPLTKIYKLFIIFKV